MDRESATYCAHTESGKASWKKPRPERGRGKLGKRPHNGYSRHICMLMRTRGPASCDHNEVMKTEKLYGTFSFTVIQGQSE